MKILILATFLIFSMGLFAQNELIKPEEFVRVYDGAYKLISKGKFQSISETSLELIRYGQPIIIPADSIVFIKTRPSKVRSVLIGSATGAVLFGIIGEATIKEEGIQLFFKSEEKWVFGTVGLILGAGVGALAHPRKKSKTFYVNGDIEKLKALTKKKM